MSSLPLRETPQGVSACELPPNCSVIFEHIMWRTAFAGGAAYNGDVIRGSAAAILAQGPIIDATSKARHQVLLHLSERQMVTCSRECRLRSFVNAAEIGATQFHFWDR